MLRVHAHWIVSAEQHNLLQGHHGVLAGVIGAMHCGMQAVPHGGAVLLVHLQAGRSTCPTLASHTSMVYF